MKLYYIYYMNNSNEENTIALLGLDYHYIQPSITFQEKKCITEVKWEAVFFRSHLTSKVVM